MATNLASGDSSSVASCGELCVRSWNDGRGNLFCAGGACSCGTHRHALPLLQPRGLVVVSVVVVRKLSQTKRSMPPQKLNFLLASEINSTLFVFFCFFVVFIFFDLE